MLETVDEHNARMRRDRLERQERASRTGVACPKCGRELRWADRTVVVTLQFPPDRTRAAQCRDCALEIRLET